jgi:3-phenylpropionate/trans-cinnamate dioxygenase ferredoxin reductase subunit
MMRRGAVAQRTSKQMSPDAADRAKGAVRMNADATREQIAVIVGAGLAGGNAAVTLRQEGWHGRIVLLGAEPGIPVGRPPPSKTYLRGEEDLSAWYVKPADWYGAHGVERRTGVTVRQVDTANKQLHLATGETVDYQQLALCMGGRNRSFAVPEATLSGVYQLRTVAECEAIRQAAHRGARALIVGMGFIGAEVAASLRQLGLDVSAVLSGAAQRI